MDEYVGFSSNHPESYHPYVWNNFFKHIDTDPGKVQIFDGNAADLQIPCDAFEKKIKEAGAIHQFFGGNDPRNRHTQGSHPVQSSGGRRQTCGLFHFSSSIPELFSYIIKMLL